MNGHEIIGFVGAACSAAGMAAWTLQLPRRSPERAIALVLAGWALLSVSILPSHIGPLEAVVGAGGAGLIGWLLAPRIDGHEVWLAVAGAATLSARIPVHAGDGTAMLLIPLYVIIGVSALHAVSHAHRVPSSGAATRAPGARLVDVAICMLLALSAASIAWSTDVDASVHELAFFLAPFALAYVVMCGWIKRGVALRAPGQALVGWALLTAVVGYLQAATHNVWWNPKVIEANRFRADFRVNSLYWDPNIFGRALVITIVLLVAWLLVTNGHRRLATAAAGAMALAGALWLTYSQSSWASLAAALTSLALLTLPPRVRRPTMIALLAAVIVAAPITYRSLAGADERGRREVLVDGLRLARERPIVGWGVGAFDAAVVSHARAVHAAAPRLTASHTTPVTIVAELGGAGLATYLLLLTGAAVAIASRWRRSHDRMSCWPPAAVIWASGAVVAILAHSMLYAGFFEDATLWVALAILTAPAATPHRSRQH